ncbi:MAG: transporter substrate-binding domain-containing protein [Alphaproteobacteria bacterium]|nr:transporter substrate-binding domain-containing protein [Alphaproteobacteria bacterium]
MRKEIPLGLLYSVTGTYGAIGRDLLDGALMAIDEINEDESNSISFKTIIGDPGGNIDEYHRMCEDMLRRDKCKQIMGTITSIGRKEVTPIIEKYDALLWYTSPYEGFEVCENIIYTGAAPNQHILPLFEHMFTHFGKNTYLVGSNYVWGWEVNRIARELIAAVDGEVQGEKYLPLDDVDVERIIDEIERKKPDFILNNLVGNSSYAFIRAYYELGKRNSDFLAKTRPIVSCDLTECDLKHIGAEAADGHLSTAVYFEKLNNDLNQTFRNKVTKYFDKNRSISSFLVSGYETVHMISKSISIAQTDEINAVMDALYVCEFETAMGRMKIDSNTNHACLTPLLGRINSNLEFDIIDASKHPIVADPYLINFSAEQFSRRIVTLERQAANDYLKVIK